MDLSERRSNKQVVGDINAQEKFSLSWMWIEYEDLIVNSYVRAYIFVRYIPRDWR